MRGLLGIFTSGLVLLGSATFVHAENGDSTARPLPPPRVTPGNGWTTPPRAGASAADAPRPGAPSGWTTPAPPLPAPPPNATTPSLAPPPPPIPRAPMPAPAPVPVARPVQPAPVPVVRQDRVRVAAASSATAVPRDAACWPLDWCGERYGRLEIHLEGSHAFLEAPEGPFGVAAVGPGLTQMRWDVLDYAGAWGGRGTIRYAVRPQHFLELRGGWLGQFDDTAAAAGRFAFRPVPPGGGGVSAATTARFFSESEVYGGELSYVAEVMARGAWRADLLGGARFVRFDELVRADNWGGTGIVLGPALAQSDVENAFVGLQLGGAVHADLSERLTVSLTLKGLVGWLERDLAIEDRNFFVGGVHRATSEDDQITWGADVDLSLRYRITPRIAATVGYHMLLLDEIVRAHDAMDFARADTGAIQPRHETDQLVVHAVLAGLHLNL